MFDDLIDGIENIPGDISAWTNSLFSPFETDTALTSNDPYYMNGGLSAQDIAGIDSPEGDGDLTKVGTNPGQNTSKANPSRTVSSAIMSALGMAGGMKHRGTGSQAHAASSAFHYQSPLNPNTVLQNTVNDIKDTSNPLNVFNALKAK